MAGPPRWRRARQPAMGGRIELHCRVVRQSTVFRTVCRPFSGTHQCQIILVPGERFELVTVLLLRQTPPTSWANGAHPWYSRLDSNQHCLRFEGSASCQLGYASTWCETRDSNPQPDALKASRSSVGVLSRDPGVPKNRSSFLGRKKPWLVGQGPSPSKSLFAQTDPSR